MRFVLFVSVALLPCACVPEPVDADGDGSFAPVDCDDAHADTHPGAPETCGNGVDDDCDGIAAGCGPAGWMDLGVAPRVTGPVLTNVQGGIQTVAGVGDLDGDGRADAAVAVYFGEDDDGAGTVWLLPQPLDGAVDLADVVPGFVGAPSDAAGVSVAGIDVGATSVVAIAGNTSDEGVAHVYLVDARPGVTLAPPDARATLIVTQPTYLPTIASTGDVDADGVGDLAVPSREGGRLWIVPGSTVGIRDIEASARTWSTDGDRLLGGVAGGDLDGDGVADLVVGDALANEVYAVPGPVLSDGRLADALGTISGPGSGYGFGERVSVGDVDGDGHADVLVSAPGDDTAGDPPGRAYLFAGPLDGPRTVGQAVASFVGDGEAYYFGTDLTASADVDGDGAGDVVVSGELACWRRGCVGVFRGPVAGARSLADADAVLVGEASNDWAGEQVADAGDVDGDGTSDLLVLSPWARTEDDRNGAAYLVLGGAGF